MSINWMIGAVFRLEKFANVIGGIMNQQMTITHPSKQQLKCSQCGNEDYFVEVMEHVENLVSSKLYTIRQLMGVPDRYYCKDCGNLVAVWER